MPRPLLEPRKPLPPTQESLWIPPTRTRLLPWGVVFFALCLAASLLATVISTERGVSGACGTLVRGQADLLHDEIRQSLRHLGRPPLPEDLESIWSNLRSEGLTYLSFHDQSPTPFLEFGTPSVGSPQATLEPCSGTPVRVGERFRISFGVPHFAKARALDPKRLGFTLEFYPGLVEELRGSARRTLGIGFLASLLFLAMGWAWGRRLQRYAQEEQARERDRRLASLGEMSAVLAHEIRNPLASLKGNCQLLVRAGPDHPKAPARAERILGETLRLEKLANRLLDFVRQGRLSPRPTKLRELLEGVVRPLEEDALPLRIEIELSAELDSWVLDPERLHQVLSNLLENALRLAHERVELRAEVQPEELWIEVRDDGPGVPGELLEEIFEPFRSGRSEGTGLGLWIARNLVEQHGGSLAAQNLDESGACFRIRLPRREALGAHPSR